MNMSEVLKRIKREDVGIYCMALPIDNPDAMLVDIIKSTTLRVYSQLFPEYDDIILPYGLVHKGYEAKKPYSSIMLPIPENDTIVFIDRVEPARNYSPGHYDASAVYGNGVYTPLQDLLLTNVETNIARNMAPSISWDFKDPREFRVYYGYCGDIYIQYAKLHDLSLSSIPLSREESFYNLCVLDCKKSLYSVIKHYNEVETVHGRYPLKIDDWQNADQERKEILNEWRDIAHLDGRTVYFA